jgi:pimeloyl-ACP methyl ester carboxylesterase
MKTLLSALLTTLIITACFASSISAAPESSLNTKELNFVFLHGFGGNSSSMQMLEDSIVDQMPAYITNYQYDNPDTAVSTAMLMRSYPNDVSIESWASNIADSINNHFANKNNLVLIGHSMGGKSALYAVSHNIGNIAEKVAMVVTINSPIKNLDSYYYIGGDTALDYWGAQRLLTNHGAVKSLSTYDSSEDAKWVSSNRHWLAFISAESSPLSDQFNSRGIDPLPRDMDDSIVPISAQYSDGADVIYYGEYAHTDFSQLTEVSNYLANQILSYIFGGNLEFSVITRTGSFEHRAHLFPGTDYWQDTTGGVLATNGSVLRRNDSYFKWQEWEDIVGENSLAGPRSTFQTAVKKSTPFFTGLIQSGWVNPDDPFDGRIYLKTRAAPRSSIQIDWGFYQNVLLPTGIDRDHYEVEVESGTQLTAIGDISWETSDLRDVRLRISSQSPGPFRWFKVNWRVYYKQSQQRKVIDEFPLQALQP